MTSEQPNSLSPQNVKLKNQLQALGAIPFFEKCLTSSDTGAHGRVVLPKAVAEAQFAQYLEKQGAQLVGEDVDGQTYDFRFRFWLNNQSRMYLIEGCLEMIKKYKLQKGDVIVFARKPDGTLVVGGRAAGPEDASKRPTLRQRNSKADEKGKPPKRRKEGPSTDGIFRAMPAASPVNGVIQEGPYYACVINIAGETYKALFSLEPDAHAAFRASCPLHSLSQPGGTLTQLAGAPAVQNGPAPPMNPPLQPGTPVATSIASSVVAAAAAPAPVAMPPVNGAAVAGSAPHAHAVGGPVAPRPGEMSLPQAQQLGGAMPMVGSTEGMGSAGVGGAQLPGSMQGMS